ncbi:MAG: hypothetical protein KC616_27095, partial [Myxococcales bacterium]|nr:hypothetical protein [Myxococcales bacterium]
LFARLGRKVELVEPGTGEANSPSGSGASYAAWARGLARRAENPVFRNDNDTGNHRPKDQRRKEAEAGEAYERSKVNFRQSSGEKSADDDCGDRSADSKIRDREQQSVGEARGSRVEVGLDHHPAGNR